MHVSGHTVLFVCKTQALGIQKTWVLVLLSQPLLANDLGKPLLLESLVRSLKWDRGYASPSQDSCEDCLS